MKRSLETLWHCWRLSGRWTTEEVEVKSCLTWQITLTWESPSVPCCFQWHKSTCISLPHTVRVNSNVKLLGFKHTIASRSIVDPQGSETFYMLYGRMQFCFLRYYCNYYSFINQCLVIWQCVILADHLRTNSVEKYLRAGLLWQTHHLSRR